MNYIDCFKKGGKTTDYDLWTGIQNLLGVDDEQMNELLQIGINKYGSEDNLISAIKEATKNINESSTEEDVKAAVVSVFSTGSEMFKCGGKMRGLVDRMSKGAKSKCGCNGITIKQTGGAIEEPTLSRKQAKQLAQQNKGFSGQQYNMAYQNAINALKKNSDLRGKELRNAARVMVAGNKPQSPVLSPPPSP